MVCQYFGNGRGSFSQRASDGATCMPAYNCRDDWNLCVQWNNKYVFPIYHVPPITLTVCSYTLRETDIFL